MRKEGESLVSRKVIGLQNIAGNFYRCSARNICEKLCVRITRTNIGRFPVQLLNRLGGLVATRRIKIRKMDRCSCILHCLCVCVSDAYGTSCRPMSPELYHAAGFCGPVPTTSREIFAETVDVLFFITSSILLLVFMGQYQSNSRFTCVIVSKLTYWSPKIDFHLRFLIISNWWSVFNA